MSPNILSPNILSPNILSPNILSTSILNPNILSPNILSSSIPDDTVVFERVWEVWNQTGDEHSYTFKSIAGDFLSEDLVYTQLLIFKAHGIPSANFCLYDVNGQIQHELLVNISDPYIEENLNESNYKEIQGNPNIEYENATFSLGSDERAFIVLRVIDTDPPRPEPEPDVESLSFSSGPNAKTVQQPEPDSFDAEAFANALGAVVVSHASTVSNPLSSLDLSLQILTNSLNPGQAGEVYPVSYLRAVGGTGLYSWTFSGLPLGMNGIEHDDPSDEFGKMLKIYGTPVESGTFVVTITVVDDENTQSKEFFLEIADPTPLTLTHSSPIPNNLTKKSLYQGLTFHASGGIPNVGAGNLYNWNIIGTPADLNLELRPSSTGFEIMELHGELQTVGNYKISVQINDNYITHLDGPERPVEITFDLCVLPLPIELVAFSNSDPIDCQTGYNPEVCALPDADIGGDYAANGVTLEVSNYEDDYTLDWEIIEGSLPPGLEFDLPLTPGLWSVGIKGSPILDSSLDYSQPFSITIEVTGTFFDPPACTVTYTTTKKFEILVKPKMPLWSAESSVNGEAVAVTNDENGNTYVTGYTSGTEDFYTIMYSDPASGVTNPIVSLPIEYVGQGSDIPSDIAYFDGLVYVTGTSDGENSGPDIYTAAYDFRPNAVKRVVWEHRYDGPSHLGDGARAVYVKGNYVYVVGHVHRGNKTAHADYVTIKYDRLSGEKIWDQTYDSTRNGNDKATAVVVDDEDNVYVTGMSQKSETSKTGPTTHDYFTVKYSSSGRVLWDARDAGIGFGADVPSNITLFMLDGNANVIVTGTTSLEDEVTRDVLNKDYYTVRYDEGGKPVWNSTAPFGTVFDGGGEDVVTGISLDSNYIYVTGRSESNPGTGNFDYVTVKYNIASGDQVGSPLRYDSFTTDNNKAVDLSVDGADLYVSGSIKIGDNADFFMIKYNDVDEIQWIAPFTVSADSEDVMTDVFFTQTGIVVTGYSLTTSGKVFLTLKYEK
ncbi:MAG: hypothetical protein MUO43_12390 [Desulfobacterales bacterium]|nr:hypothetical protein [Desulfobacterales bacterium]